MLKRLARWLVDLTAAGLAFATTLVGFAAWWLSGTSVTLDDVVTPYLERSMTAPYQMEIRSTAIRWGGFQQPLRLVAQDAVIRDGNGLPVLRVTELELGVDAQALLSGHIRPTDLTMVGARLYAARDAEGRVTAGFAASDHDAMVTEEAAPSEELLDALLAGLRGEPTAAVEDLDSLARLEIADATVVVVDRGHQLVWTVPDVHAVLSRDNGRIRGSLDFSLPAAGAEATVSGRFLYDAAAETVAIDTALNDFVPAGLAGVDPVLAPLQALRARIDGTMALTLGADLRPIDGRLSVDADALSLEMPELFDAPLAIARMRLEAGIDFVGRQLAITQAAVNLGGPRLSGSAVVAWTDEEIRTEADLTLTDLPMALLPRYWPNPFNRSARAWIGGRMHEGTVLGASLGIATRSSTEAPLAVEVTDVDVGLAYADLSVLFMNGLPPVRAIDGIGHFDGEEFTLVVERGQLLDLDVGQAVIRITDFDQVPETMDIEVTASGPLPSALAVIDRPRLGYATALGLVPDDVGGTVSSELRFTFPLAAQLPFEDVDVQVSADIADAALGTVFDGMQVDALTGALTLDGAGFTFDGRARLNGVPLDAVWRQPFTAGGSRQVDLRGRLDAAALAAFGLPVPDGFDGAAPVTAQATRGSGETGTISVVADLTPVALAIPALDHTKAIGTPGRLAADVTIGADGTVTIDDIALEMPGLSAAGTVRLAPDGSPAEVALSNVEWAGNRLTLTAMPQGDGLCRRHQCTAPGPVRSTGAAGRRGQRIRRRRRCAADGDAALDQCTGSAGVPGRRPAAHGRRRQPDAGAGRCQRADRPWSRRRQPGGRRVPTRR